ncbi:hypothetical protein [Hymenobacter jeollabukensis]|uniref:Uncharacterized protein n=1 Tax=Hymenobacter jeollabukensis TaxID=2025313 RepID=A0A5R8WLJ4_9BACT|nr:hypothetical protein [Hymenobacter jeollabukensis]TLM90035.1 hypothetical protein FDY95_18620 [Hymenobacter jeollabukensis]
MNKLKTRAQCLDAKEKLEAELDGYQNRDNNLAFQDRREGRADASAASRLSKATARIAQLTDQLAQTDLSEKDRLRYQRELVTANYQKDLLDLRPTSTGGVDEFLADVDSDQVDAQVALLTQAIADVQARHDALPA